MAEKEPGNKLNGCEKPSDEKSDSKDSDFTFNMQKCSEALEDAFNQDYINQHGTRTTNTKVESEACDDADNDDEEEEENGVSSIVEYDEEHLKELHLNMSDDQLQELKKESGELKNQGNDLYKSQSFREAADMYTQALNCCPLQFTTERSILYGNRAAAYIGMDNNKNALVDCDKAIELNPKYLKVLSRRAQIHRKLDNLELCLEDYKKVLEIDPGIRCAREACATLPAEIHDKNEKLKTEMMGKLKDLGNMVLRPFGLSTDNFNMVQDPNTGGYSINFQK